MKKDELLKEIFSQSPERVALLDFEGKIYWHNSAFLKTFSQQALLGACFSQLVSDKISWPPDKQESQTMMLGQKINFSLSAVNENFLLNVKPYEENDLSAFHHDIRSAFNAPIGFIALVIENLQTAKSKRLNLAENIEFLNNSYARLLDMIYHSDSFLLTKRIQNKTYKANFASFDLLSFFAEIKEDFDISFRKNKIELVRKPLMSPSFEVKADKGSLKIAIRNALQNAAEEIIDSKLIGEKRRLFLNYGIREGLVYISIENYAKEPEEKVQHIFKNRSSKSYGNGMGSEAIKSIIEFHQGSVKAEAKGEKIIVTLSFPA